MPMKFSTKTTYGIRAMVYLAQNSGKKSVSLAKVAKDENMSLKYLERLFSGLRNAGLVKAEKGAGGGYRLALKPDKISVYGIVSALEGKTSLFHCLDAKGKIYCSNKCNCEANFVLEKVQHAINSTLKEITLNKIL